MSLTVTELRALLSSLSLDTRGNKSTLKSRLAKHNKSTSSTTSPTPPRIQARKRPNGQEYDSYLVFDVEATCERLDGVPRLAFASVPSSFLALRKRILIGGAKVRQVSERDYRMARDSPSMETNSLNLDPASRLNDGRGRGWYRGRVEIGESGRVSFLCQTDLESDTLAILYRIDWNHSGNFYFFPYSVAMT